MVRSRPHHSFFREFTNHPGFMAIIGIGAGAFFAWLGIVPSHAYWLLVAAWVCFGVAALPMIEILKNHGWKTPRARQAGGVYFLVVTLVLTIFCIEASQRPNLSFQKMALFWVKTDQDVYQLGIIAKVYNADAKAHFVRGLSFDGCGWSLFPRGSYVLRHVRESDRRFDLRQDTSLSPFSPAYLKELLPIKIEMTLLGNTPDFVLRGKWKLETSDGSIAFEPNLYSVFKKIVLADDWRTLNTPAGNINVENLQYKPLPTRPANNSQVFLDLLYNSDKSAKIENPYIGQTNYIENEHGVMVFVVGRGEVPTDDGWTVLGHSYYEVWSDPSKLALYNSIFPPSTDGLPQPFGFFEGEEERMSGPVGRHLLASTTRTADILEYFWRNCTN